MAFHNEEKNIVISSWSRWINIIIDKSSGVDDIALLFFSCYLIFYSRRIDCPLYDSIRKSLLIFLFHLSFFLRYYIRKSLEQTPSVLINFSPLYNRFRMASEKWNFFSCANTHRSSAANQEFQDTLCLVDSVVLLSFILLDCHELQCHDFVVKA